MQSSVERDKFVGTTNIVTIEIRTFFQLFALFSSIVRVEIIHVFRRISVDLSDLRVFLGGAGCICILCIPGIGVSLVGAMGCILGVLCWRARGAGCRILLLA